MKKIKIGILGTADIAFRRFLPALQNIPAFEYVGVATRTAAKAKKFQDEFGGSIYEGYDQMISDDGIDALYIPLPPALHKEYAKKALASGKHVLLEKPFTTSKKDTEELIDLARKQNLAVFENYMFVYHSQLQKILQILQEGKLGDLRLVRCSFGFPFKGANDFRYNKELGGGALLDCGGYPLKLAGLFLGSTARVVNSELHVDSHFSVDTYGSATLCNENGLTAQISYGMDNAYVCQLELFGSKGKLTANRIFTAPPDMEVELALWINNATESIRVEKTNQFMRSIQAFYGCIQNPSLREEVETAILRQGDLVEQIRDKGRFFQ